jgi:hypothetical protein
MKRLAAVALAGVLSAVAARGAPAQDQEALKKKHDDLVAEAWVKEGGWVVDYDAAREQAKKGGKLLCAYFTRSYAT